MAYLNHDLDDAIRSGVITADQVPAACERVLGRSHSQRATTMVRDLVFNSHQADGDFTLQFSDGVLGAMTHLREFMYTNVYRSSRVHNEFVKAKKILSELYDFFAKNEEHLERELAAMDLPAIDHNGDSRERVVCDLIASMTDRYALDRYIKLFFPSPLV
jgi:dGTPase